MILALKVVKLTKNIFKKKLLTLISDINYFDEWVKYNDENPKINKAKKEILTLLPIIAFSLTIVVFTPVYCSIVGIEKKEGSGFIFFGETIIFVLWLIFAFLRTNKSHKRHSRQYPKENCQ